MGKTKDFKKIKDTKGTFHAKMGTIKDRKSMDLKKEDTRYKKYIPFNENIITKDTTNFYDDKDNLVFSYVIKVLLLLLLLLSRFSRV